LGFHLSFQFLGGGELAEAHVGALIVVSPEPLCCVILHLADGCEVVLAQPFVADGPVVAFDIGILLRLARLCQSALNIDPVSASKNDPLLGGVERAHG
jgi:hypothetical protein